VTSKVEYGKKYCQENLKVFVIGFVIVGNPFPVIEHPFMINEEGQVMLQKDKPKKNEEGYLGKPINPGYQSHFTLGIFFCSFCLEISISIISIKIKKLMVDIFVQHFQ